MNPSEWARAKSLLADAADLAVEDRERYVSEHCSDPDVRRELLDLLTSPAPLSGIVAINALTPGDRLGPYSVQGLVGVGGMGEVYRGRDTRLGRDVALKVISPKRVGDPSLRRRFELEARAASALNHPSIVTIYDVGEADGVSWIAMEWVEGRTLRQALTAGPLTVRDACSIARQIAEGLAAAHAKGIVHRDLKPENIMLSAEGRTKILDFGLVRQTLVNSSEAASCAVETMPTAVTAASFEGMIVGTVGYMSPEQASGRAADFRSDQFALGLVVYEMLAGRRAFARGTAVETLSAVIREDPIPLESIRGGIPERLLNSIARCLAKSPENRFASTPDLVVALAGVETSSVLATEAPAVWLPPAQPTIAPPTGRARATRRAAVVSSALVGLVMAAAGWTWLHHTTSAIDSMAVLPFENASRQQDAEYISDGITESLINQMSRVTSLKVMARGTVFRFKGAGDPQDVGRKLGVGAVVTGTVARRGDQLVISAELIETATGLRLWGDSYDRPFADLQRVQDSIVSEISDGLRLRLSGQEKRTLVAHGTENPEAYQLFLRARFLMSEASEEGDLEARRLFEQALEKDPKFVDARVGVAGTYARSAGEGYEPPSDGWPRADEESRKVLELDPGNVAARTVLAVRRFEFDWDWPAAEREFREVSTDARLFRGIQYQPVAMFFWARGRPDEAVALIERALRVDPENLESRIMMADFLAEAGRLDEAIAANQAIARVAASNPRPFLGLAGIWKRRGDIKSAIDALRKAYELSGEEHGTRLLAIARTDNDYERAEAAVARDHVGILEALSKERYVSPLDLARLYAQVGEREKAFAMLESALGERSAGLVLLKADRAWDPIRDDARFAAVVKRVGIP